MSAYWEFYRQAKLQADTNNENGDAVSFLMSSWHDMRKEELARIAIESMIAAERQLKIAECGIKSLFNDDIAAYYEDICENLAEYYGENEEEN